MEQEGYSMEKEGHVPWKGLWRGALEALEPGTSTQRTVRRLLPPTQGLKDFANVGLVMKTSLFDKFEKYFRNQT